MKIFIELEENEKADSFSCSKAFYELCLGSLCKHYDCEPHLEPCVSCKTKYDAPPTKFSAKKRTNADRIRAMSDEELAEVLGKLVHCGGCPMRDNCNVDDLPCDNVLIGWLKQPAEAKSNGKAEAGR